MSAIVRNVAAVLGGLVIGSVVNMAIVIGLSSFVPPPAGVDVGNAESIARSIHLFEPKHFLAPFLAHALGTLAGALAAYLIAATHKPRFAFAIGAVFLCAGVAASFMIPAPAWFMALDLLVAYLPMAWLAMRIGRCLQPVARRT
jgi:hypothetical protein